MVKIKDKKKANSKSKAVKVAKVPVKKVVKKAKTVKKSIKKPAAKKPVTKKESKLTAKKLRGLVSDVIILDEVADITEVPNVVFTYGSGLFDSPAETITHVDMPATNDIPQFDNILQDSDEFKDITNEFINQEKREDGYLSLTPAQRILYMLGEALKISFSSIANLVKEPTLEPLITVPAENGLFFRVIKNGERAPDWKPTKKITNPAYFRQSWAKKNSLSSNEEKIIERIIDHNLNDPLLFGNLLHELNCAITYKKSRPKYHKPKDEDKIFNIIYNKDKLNPTDITEYTTLVYTLESDLIKYFFWNDPSIKLESEMTPEFAKQYLDRGSNSSAPYKDNQSDDQIHLFSPFEKLPSDKFIKDMQAKMKESAFRGPTKPSMLEKARDELNKNAELIRENKRKSDKEFYQKLNLGDTSQLTPEQLLDKIKQKVLNPEFAEPGTLEKKTNTWVSDKEWFEAWKPEPVKVTEDITNYGFTSCETPTIPTIFIPSVKIQDGYSFTLESGLDSNFGYYQSPYHIHPIEDSGIIKIQGEEISFETSSGKVSVDEIISAIKPKDIESKDIKQTNEFDSEEQLVEAYRASLLIQKSFLVAKKNLLDHYKREGLDTNNIKL